MPCCIAHSVLSLLLFNSFNSTDAQALLKAHYGEGSGEIYLANVACLGNESALLECPSIGLGWFCTHDDDASVFCEGRKARLLHVVRLRFELCVKYMVLIATS